MKTASTRPKRRRVLLIGVLLLVALALGVALFPRTEWARALARDLVSEALTNALHGSLAIGSIEGNLWGAITLHEVTLTGTVDTIARLPRLEVEYDLLGLLRKEIRLRHVVVDSLRVHLQQSEEGTWNLAEIIPAGDSAAAVGEPSPWTLSVTSLSIRGLSASIAPRQPVPGIPENLDSLDLEGSFVYAPDRWTVSIERCMLSTTGPHLHVHRLALEAEGNARSIRIDSMSLATDSIALTSSASVSLPPGRASSGALQLSAPSLAEIRRFLPGFPLTKLPPLRLTADYVDDVLHLRGTLGSEALTLDGTLATAGPSSIAKIRASFAGIDPAEWLTATVPSMNLTGRLSGQASIDDPLDQGVEFALALEPSTVATRIITQAEVTGEVAGGDLNARIVVTAPEGEISGSVRIRDLRGSQELAASLDFAGVDPARVANLQELDGTLNGSLALNGHPLDIDRFRGGILLEVRPSKIPSLTLDSLLLRCSVASPEITIDTMALHSPPLEIEATGRATLKGDADIAFGVHLKDPFVLASLAGLDTVSGRGELRGTFRKNGDSLTVAGLWGLAALAGFGLTVDSLSGNAFLEAGPTGVALKGEIAAREVRTGALRADSLTALARYHEGRFSLESSLAFPGNTSVTLKALAMRDSLVHLLIPALEATIEKDDWTSGPDTIRCILEEGTLSIASATLSSGARSIAASGTLSLTGMNEFSVTIERLPISYVQPFLESFPPLQGDLSMALRLEGMLPEPSASCSVVAEGVRLGNQTLGDSRAVAAYHGDSTLTWQVSTTGRYGNRMTAEGALPLRHTREWDSVDVDPDRPLEGRLLLEDYQLSRIAPALPGLDRLKGVASSDLSLGGTLRSPVFSGSLRIDSGAVFSSALGIAYDSISVEIAGEDTLLLLRRFDIRGNQGSLKATGILASVSDLLGVALRPRQLDVEMRNFLATESQSLEMRLSGPLTLRAEKDTLRVEGDLTVSRARLWLPAFFRGGSSTGDGGTPLLVAALQAEDSAAFQDSLRQPGQAATALQSVAGRIRARIPNNTWLQSKELNVEISGDLTVILRGPEIAIAGFAKVERGTFMVLGKKFVVKEGRADFAGGTDPIPLIWMEVAYSFRRPDGIQQSLDLQITGKATTPSLSFRLNGEPVNEQDAVSYVLFGRSLDDLSQSQKSSVSQSTGDLAAGLAASFLTAQLSSTVGQAFGLDVLELNVQDAGRQSSFTAGKYLSDRLYVRYTRKINDPSSNETTTDEVALEYRLLPFLYLQMIQGTSKATGYDLLFRFD